MSGTRTSARIQSMKATLHEDVGRAMRTAREAAGMSQRELAACCDTTQNSIAAVERGERTCSLFLLVAVADALDTTLDALVPISVDVAADHD